MDRFMLTEAFNLAEDVEEFNLSASGLNELDSFLDMAGDTSMMDDEAMIIDLEAQAEDELKQSYNGKVIINCNVCHSNIFIDKEEIELDEEDNVNIDLECPYCHSIGEGYTIIGEVKPFEEETEEEEIEDKVEEIEVEAEVEPENEAEIEEAEVEEDEENLDEALSADRVEELGKVDELNGKLGLGRELEASDEIRGPHYTELNEAKDDKVSIAVDFFPEDDDDFKEFKRDMAKYCPTLKLKYDSNAAYEQLKVTGPKKDVLNWLVADEDDFGGCGYGGEGGTVGIEANMDWLEEFYPELLEACDKAKGPHCEKINESLADDLEREVAKVLRDHGYKSDYETVVAAADYIKMTREETGEDYSVEEWLNDTIENYPEELVKINESLEEDIQAVSITTDEETMTMDTKEDGGVIIETEPVVEEEEVPEEEMIAPLDAETAEEIEAEQELEDEPEFAEEEPEFDEESFNGLGESYLKKCYDNVNSFKTTSVELTEGVLTIEGNIGFASGNEKATKFVFEGFNSNEKQRLNGCNEQISRGKKSFKLGCTVENGKVVCESLNYNYKTKNENDESVRVYGTVRKAK